MSRRGYLRRLAHEWHFWAGAVMVWASLALWRWPDIVNNRWGWAVVFWIGALLIFWSQHHVWQSTERERKRWEDAYRRSFMDDEIEHLYGPNAVMRRIDRVNGLRARWDSEAAQVRGGHFANAAVIPLLAREYRRVLHYVFRNDHPSRQRQEDDIREVLELVRRRFFEEGRDLDAKPPTGPPRSAAPAPAPPPSRESS